jgi:hypothetical protein
LDGLQPTAAVAAACSARLVDAASLPRCAQPAGTPSTGAGAARQLAVTAAQGPVICSAEAGATTTCTTALHTQLMLIIKQPSLNMSRPKTCKNT